MLNDICSSMYCQMSEPMSKGTIGIIIGVIVGVLLLVIFLPIIYVHLIDGKTTVRPIRHDNPYFNTTQHHPLRHAASQPPVRPYIRPPSAGYRQRPNSVRDMFYKNGHIVIDSEQERFTQSDDDRQVY